MARGVAVPASPWWRRLPVERIVVATGVVAVLFQWATIFLGRHGDFPYHWEWGRRFVAREFLYAGGMHLPYPPFWAMAHAPLTVFPVRVAQILVFALAVGAIALVLWILDRLARSFWPVDRAGLFWSNAAALFLASRFFLQDLAHSGGNTLLLLLVWAGVFFWAARRDFAGGLCLGLATALKCTPALFLAYFAWKRQWRIVVAGASTALLLTVAPVLRQGPVEYARHMTFWASNAWKATSTADPAVGFLGPEELGNLSLKAGIDRVLSLVPVGAPSADADWKSWPVRLSPVLLLLAVAWVFRGRADRRSAWILFELAAVGLLALMLSPITWKQHCVATLPALYLLVRRAISRGAASVRGGLLLAGYTLLAIGLNRTLAGQGLWTWLDSRAILTFCVLGLLLATTACAAQTGKEGRPHRSRRMWTIRLPVGREPEDPAAASRRQVRAAWRREQFETATVRRRVHRGAAVACLTFSVVLAVAIFFPGRWSVLGIPVRLDTIRNPLIEFLASVAVFVGTREGGFSKAKETFRRISRFWSRFDVPERIFTVAVAAQIGAAAVYAAKSPDRLVEFDRWMRRISSTSFEDAAREPNWYLQHETCFEECRRKLPPSARVLYHGRMEVQLLCYVLYPRPVFMLPTEWYSAWLSHQLLDPDLPKDPLFPGGLPRPPVAVSREAFLREHRITHEVTFVEDDSDGCRIEAVR